MNEKGDDPTLEPGKHSFEFKIKLPDGPLPSSFEGEYGAIKYWVKGYIDRRFWFDDVLKIQFTVLDIIDVNERKYNVRMFLICSHIKDLKQHDAVKKKRRPSY